MIHLQFFAISKWRFFCFILEQIPVMGVWTRVSDSFLFSGFSWRAGLPLELMHAAAVQTGTGDRRGVSRLAWICQPCCAAWRVSNYNTSRGRAWIGPAMRGISTNARRCINAGFMLAQRRRSWADIKTTLLERLVLLAGPTEFCEGALTSRHSPTFTTCTSRCCALFK